MATLSVGMRVSGAGVDIDRQLTRTGDGFIAIEPTVNTAKALGGWVKGVGDGDATATLTAGHLWSTGVGDVYWTGGRRYDVTVTIATDAVTLEAGTGDVYPATANATVKLAMHQQVNQIIDGDLLEFLAICFESTTAGSTARGHVHAEDAAADVIADLDFDANEPRFWDVDSGQTNSFTGDVIAALYITMDSTTESVKCKVVGIQDVTP
jgi:hypothetical protein